MILAVMQQRVDWHLVPSVIKESVVLVSVVSRVQGHCAEHQLDSVTLKTGALETHLTVQLSTFKTALLVTTVRPTATSENVRLMMLSARHTS